MYKVVIFLKVTITTASKSLALSAGYRDNKSIKQGITRLSLCTFISWVSVARLWAAQQF